MTGVPTFKPAGDAGLLVELAQTASDGANRRVIALDHAIAAAQIDGIREVIPALVNLMVRFDPLVTDHATIQGAVRALFPVQEPPQSNPKTHIIPVCYDPDLCPDLSHVAGATGLSTSAVITAHLNARLTVSMYGFAPGYAYLSGLPKVIHVPRKTIALRDVPKGSILIAGAQSIITPLTMPTGWNIIGRSPTEIIQSHATDPFLFGVGDIVTFTRIPRADLPERLQTPRQTPRQTP